MHELRATQDRIIEEAIEGEKILTFYLKSGVSLKGTVLAHDSYTVFMLHNQEHTLVYKHFITSVFPARLNRQDDLEAARGHRHPHPQHHHQQHGDEPHP